MVLRELSGIALTRGKGDSLIRNSGTKMILTVLCAFAITATAVLTNPAAGLASYVYEGSDWGGKDFTPANGDILVGTFTNIGRFAIGAGDTVYAGSNLLALSVNDMLVNGTIYGGAALSPSLNLTSKSSITIGSTGAIDQWKSVSLSAGGITLNGTISCFFADGSVSTIGAGQIIFPPGNILSRRRRSCA